MSCLRCGRATEEKQAFCDECLALMEKHPVKPGIAVHLPHREPSPQEKKPAVRHREPTPAEQVVRLRKVIRWLFAMIAVLSVLLLLTAGMLLHIMGKSPVAADIGKNYTTAGTKTQP